MGLTEEGITQWGPYVWELALAIIFTMVGLVVSQNQLGKREKKRVLSELTSIQREIHTRATYQWTSDTDTRQVWMISLYFQRVETLKELLSDREKLPISLNQKFESYENALRKFGRVWANTANRNRNFWEAYHLTYKIFHDLTRQIDKHYVIENHAVFQMLKESEAIIPNAYYT